MYFNKRQGLFGNKKNANPHDSRDGLKSRFGHLHQALRDFVVHLPGIRVVEIPVYVMTSKTATESMKFHFRGNNSLEPSQRLDESYLETTVTLLVFFFEHPKKIWSQNKKIPQYSNYTLVLDTWTSNFGGL